MESIRVMMYVHAHTSGWSMPNIICGNFYAMKQMMHVCTYVLREDSLHCCFSLHCISAGQYDMCSGSCNSKGRFKAKSSIASSDDHHLATQINTLNHLWSKGPSLLESWHCMDRWMHTHAHTSYTTIHLHMQTFLHKNAHTWKPSKYCWTYYIYIAYTVMVF